MVAASTLLGIYKGATMAYKHRREIKVLGKAVLKNSGLAKHIAKRVVRKSAMMAISPYSYYPPMAYYR